MIKLILVELTYVDQGYTDAWAAEAARVRGIELEVVKLRKAKRGFVLLPQRGRRALRRHSCRSQPRGFACTMLKKAALLLVDP